MPSRDQIESLLYDLCVAYGFCLPTAEHEKLIEEPPGTVDAFTDAVYRAEGLGPIGRHSKGSPIARKGPSARCRDVPFGERTVITSPTFCAGRVICAKPPSPVAPTLDTFVAHRSTTAGPRVQTKVSGPGSGGV